MNKKNIINEFVLEFNGKRYVPIADRDIPYDGHTSCRKCAFDSECMKNASRAVVPVFGNDPCRGKNQICRKLECIWVEVK